MFWRFDRLPVTEERDDDRQSDRGFSGSDRHDEEHEHLPRRRRTTCANATNVRFTALSISSTHMKMMIALRR